MDADALATFHILSQDACLCSVESVPLHPRKSDCYLQVLPSDIDLLHPPAELEKQKHKLKRLVQSPNSFFMDVKCQGCFQMYVLASKPVQSCSIPALFFAD